MSSTEAESCGRFESVMFPAGPHVVVPDEACGRAGAWRLFESEPGLESRKPDAGALRRTESRA